MKKGLFLILLALSTYSALAQKIHTINGDLEFEPFKGLKYYSEFFSSNAKGYYLMISKNILSKEDVDLLDSHNIQVLHYLEKNGYVVHLHDFKNDAIPILDKMILGIYHIPKEMKMDKSVYEQMTKLQNSFQQGLVLVSFYTKPNFEDILHLGWSKSLTEKYYTYLFNNTYVFELNSFEKFNALLQMNSIEFVTTFKDSFEQNSTSNSSMQSNQIHSINYDRNGPIGRNTYFSNIEGYGGYMVYSMNTKGRDHPIYGDGLAKDLYTSPGHGTSVNLYATASNNRDEYNDRGMAEGATIFQMPSYNSIADYYSNKQLQPLTLNVSAGVGGGTVSYNSTAKELDRITRMLRAFSMSFSAGNNGSATNPALNYGPGWANISSDDKSAKNTFTVHAAGYPGEHYDWACKGPTFDGRLKPDISAEGKYGTSYASPNLAGLINVLYESYTISYSDSPRSDVVKAAILNTAIDADKQGIDFKTGFGTLNPYRANKTIVDKRIFSSEFLQGQNTVQSYNVTIPANQNELKVLLYWHDYQGTPGAAKALINDLDLKIIDPLGNQYLPWVLDASPGNQYNLPLRKVDSLNNVEQITLNQPPPGNYTIQIKANKVPFGPQKYVVVYDYVPEYIEITSPVQNFRTARAKSILFTWNSSLNTNNYIDIFLLYPNNTNTLIASVESSKKYYEYLVTSNLPYDKYRIIVKQRGTSIADTSGYFHIMQTPLNLRFKSICDTEIKLQWEPIAIPGVKYIIYHLGEKYMEEIKSVDYPNSIATIQASEVYGTGMKFSKNDWFAVAAMHPNGAKSLRTYPISYSQTNSINLNYSLKKEYQLCYSDTVSVTALQLDMDSIRWYLNSVKIPNQNSRQIKLIAQNPGQYYYRIYKNNCVFTSDTFSVRAYLDFSDTLEYGVGSWNVYVLKNDAAEKYYGKAEFKKLSIISTEYYNELDGNITDLNNYKGCDPGMTYTLIYKRKGFIKGTYKFKLNHIQFKAKIFLNNALIYQSPENTTNLGEILNLNLDENSEIRIEHLGRGRTIIKLEITPINVASPVNINHKLGLWLKPDYLLNTNKDSINRWKDSYPNALPNNSIGDPIKVNKNGLNFYPTLNFSDYSGLIGDINNNNDNEACTFVVFKANKNSDAKSRIFSFAVSNILDESYNLSYVALMKDDDKIGIKRNTYSLFSNDSLLEKWNIATVQMNSNNAKLQFNNSSTILQSNFSFSGLLYARYNIGIRSDSSLVEGNMNGEIAEIIHFTRSLSNEELNKIQSYLAIKYGLKHSGELRDLRDRKLYTSANFNTAMAGVGHDSKAALYHTQSKSEYSKDVFIGSIDSIDKKDKKFTCDSCYVIWAHNNREANFDTLNNYSKRLKRVWRLQNTGSLKNFYFNFILDSNIIQSCANYYLLTSSDSNFNTYTKNKLSLTQQGSELFWSQSKNIDSLSSIYFTVQLEQDTFRSTFLKANNSIDLQSCLYDSTIYFIDSNSEYHASILNAYKEMSFKNIQLSTNYSNTILSNCNINKAYSFVNRSLSFENLSLTDSISIRFNLASFDTLEAREHLETKLCDSFDVKLNWYVYTDSVSFIEDLKSFLLNESKQLSNVKYSIVDSMGYVELKLPYQTAYFLAAVFTDSLNLPAFINSRKSQLQIYPNPVRDKLFIKNVGSEDNLQIEIFDLHGKQILHLNEMNEEYVDLSMLQHGLYILKIGTAYKKLLKY